MMSVCQRYVRCPETARDLLHDGFIKLFKKIHDYSGSGSFNGWMIRIFVTTALDHLRQKDVLRHSLEVEHLDYMVNDHDISVYEHLSANEIFECVTKLPDIYRTVFNMHAIEGYTHVEIAQELGVSDNTVRSRYAKARELLQNLYLGNSKSDWRFYVSGGFMVEKRLQAVYRQEENWGNHIRPTTVNSAIGGLQWSLNMGFGVRYKLEKGWGVYFEPRAGYSFNNHQPISIRTEYPIFFGVNFGLNYSL